MNIDQHGADHILLLYSKVVMGMICLILYSIPCALKGNGRGFLIIAGFSSVRLTVVNCVPVGHQNFLKMECS